jgi:superfamily II DNA or RNA helicase
VWDDLVSSPQATLVAGYSSIAELIQLIADWDDTKHDLGRVRLVFGAEPFNTSSHTFRSDRKEFTAEARTYWLEERGISLRLSAKVLQAIETIEQGRISARFVHGTRRLHAKIFVGVTAATLGSSNFTSYGLDTQFEANARFEAVREKARYREVAAIAQNFWEAAEAWDDELRSLLEDLLHVVSWQEALARACAELLEGVWAERYMTSGGAAELELWPSQRAGIAEALWITENVGSVLVADATGSGKTRMGAHLVRATRDRLWRTGRARRDLTVLVGPPAVVDTWRSEAVGIGLMISTVSHGKLSRAGESGRRLEEEEVRGAQILAVDEAHNFLNTSSKRTQHVRDSLADNVMLFTATPISRGASDLLNLVGLLGPDNFDDATLEVLNRLDRQRRFGEILTPDEIDTVRREIQRFTVRRTKAQINEMVDRDPEAYVHPITGRTCRYPNHDARIYRTGETAQDTNIANAMRPIVDDLSGIAQLERHIAVPPGLQRYYTDEEWLRFRLRSARGLVRHHVLEALRSSRAALVEHLLGTTVAAERFGIDAHFKAIETGDQLVKIDRLIEAGPPEIELACEVDRWLTDPDLWESACRLERTRYTSIGDHVDRISDAREEAKVKLLAGLCARHSLVLAFDRHPITLAVLKEGLRQADLDGADVLVATSFGSQRKKVIQRFAAGEEGRAIALCSDAMSEGLNLQGASCIVHLDLPTTLRVAEQRVGRVDRMDSRHTTIEAWWPQDGPAFATRAYEKLVRRAKDSESLLGSNLTVPELDAVDEAEVVKVEDQIKELDTAALKPWDGIQDALDPVRQIIHGAHPLVTQEIYNHYREERHRVISRVAPLYSKHPWAFFAVAGIAHGAPRWMIIDPREPQVCVTDLTEVVARLRNFLAEDPPKRELDEVAVAAMERCLDIATRAERNLLPRRMLRALDQMSTVLKAWAKKARQAGDEEGATDWLALETLASSPHPKVDPYLVAERWLTLIGPTFEQHRAEARGRRYILLSDIAPRLAVNPLSYDEVAGTFVDLPQATPLDERVSACIIGVPDPE